MLSHNRYTTRALLAAFTAMSLAPAVHADWVDNSGDKSLADTPTTSLEMAVDSKTVDVTADLTGDNALANDWSYFVYANANSITLNQGESLTLSTTYEDGGASDEVASFFKVAAGKTGATLNLADGKTVTLNATGAPNFVSLVSAESDVAVNLGAGSSLVVTAADAGSVASAVNVDGSATVSAVTGDITVTGTDTAYGVKASADATLGNVSGNVTVTANNYASAVEAAGNVTVGDLAADKTISAAASADGGVAKTIKSDADLNIGSIAGTVSASGDGGATAIRSTGIGSNNVIGDVTGQVTATGGGTVDAITVAGDLDMGVVDGKIAATATDENPTAAAVTSGGTLDINSVTGGEITADATYEAPETGHDPNVDVVATAVVGSGAITMGDLAAVEVTPETEEQAAVYSGKISATATFVAPVAEEGQTPIVVDADVVAKAIAGDAEITVGNIGENFEVSATASGGNSTAAAIVSEGSGKLVQVGDVAGTVSATAGNEAAAISSEGAATIGAVSGQISATAATAEGIYGNGAITVGEVSGKISALGESSAKAISGDDTITVGDVTVDGKILATASEAGSAAAAIVSEGSGSLVKVGNVEGVIAATGGLNVAAISSEGGVTVGDVSGTIRAIANDDNGVAEAIFAEGDINTGEISGTISAYGGASAVAINGNNAANTVTVGNVTEDGEIIAVGDVAVGVKSAGALTMGNIEGKFHAVSQTENATATGMKSAGAFQAGNLSGDVDVKAVYTQPESGVSENVTLTAVGIEGQDNITVDQLGGKWLVLGDFKQPEFAEDETPVTVNADVRATLVHGQSDITLTTGVASGAEIEVAGEDYAGLFVAENSGAIDLGDVNGHMVALSSTESDGVKTAGDVTIGTFTDGSIAVGIDTAGSNAIAVQGDTSVTIGDFVGESGLSALGGGYVRGIQSAGAITVGSTAEGTTINAIALDDDGDAVAIESVGNNTVQIGATTGYIYAQSSGSAAAVRTDGDVNVASVETHGYIKGVAQTGHTYGIYAGTGATVGDIAELSSISAVTANSEDIGNAHAIYVDNGDASIGNVAGYITSVAGEEAIGIEANAVTILDVSGSIYASTLGDVSSATAISGESVSIGAISGKIRADGQTACAIEAETTFESGDVTGDIVALGDDVAVGIVADQIASPLVIDGGMIYTSTYNEGGLTAAISTQSLLATVTEGEPTTYDWAEDSADVDDTVTLKNGANIVGDIRLGDNATDPTIASGSPGAGDGDVVNLVGYGSYADDMIDVETLNVNGAAIDTSDIDADKAANVWALSGDSEFVNVNVNSGFLMADTGLDANQVTVAADAGLYFEIKDDGTSNKLTVSNLKFEENAIVYARPIEALTDSQDYEIIETENDIVIEGAGTDFENVVNVADTALVNFSTSLAFPEIVSGETTTSDMTKVILHAEYQGLGSLELGGDADAGYAFESMFYANGGAENEINDLMTEWQNLPGATEEEKAESAKKIADTLTRMSPKAAMAVASTTTSTAAAVAGKMSSRSTTVGVPMAKVDGDDAYALLFAGPSMRDENGYEMWTTAFGNITDQDNDNGVYGFESTAFGTLVGLDRQVGDLMAGVAVGYARAEIDGNCNTGKTDVDTLSLGAYFAYAPSAFQINGGLIYTYGSSDIQHNTALNNIAIADDVLSHNITPYLGVSYNIAIDGKPIVITPSAQIAYTYFTQDSYEEKGAGAFNLNVDSFDNDIFTGMIGVQTAYQVNDSLKLSSSLNYKYDFINDAPEVESIFQAPGATPFRSVGLETDKQAVELGAGFEWRFNDKIKASADYNAEFRENMDAHNLTFGVNVSF